MEQLHSVLFGALGPLEISIVEFLLNRVVFYISQTYPNTVLSKPEGVHLQNPQIGTVKDLCLHDQNPTTCNWVIKSLTLNHD